MPCDVRMAQRLQGCDSSVLHDSFGWVQGHEESPNVSSLMEF